MRCTRVLCGAVAAVLGVQGGFAMSHGEISEYYGKNVRWQELAKGIFTGIPEEEWDDDYHTKGNVEWDINEIIANSTTSTSSDDTLVDSRDLKGMCKATQQCVVHGSQYVLLLAYNAWISTANYAAHGSPRKDLMEFLNQPFVANAAGVAVAGIVSGQINGATKKECSTDSSESSQADIIHGAVQAVLEKNPEAKEISVDVDGPSGTVNVKVKAGPPNTSPNPSC